MIFLRIFGLGFIVFLASVAFWAAAPKGTMSCRTQGDFRSFVRPSVCADLSLEDLI